MWRMVELCVGVLNWPFDRWQEAGLFEVAAALSGRAYLHGLALPYYQSQTGPDKEFLTQMMAMRPDQK